MKKLGFGTRTPKDPYDGISEPLANSLKKLDHEIKKMDLLIKNLGKETFAPNVEKVSERKWTIDYDFSSYDWRTKIKAHLDELEIAYTLSPSMTRFKDNLTFPTDGDEARFIFYFNGWFEKHEWV